MPDILLTAYLVLLLPAYQLWRSLRRREAASPQGAARFFRTILIAASPMAALVALWGAEGRSWIALGLGLGLAGAIGLVVAAVALAFMAVLVRRQMTAPGGPPKLPGGILPTTPQERRLALASGLLVGVAWECLYRGYLLWFLAPRLGLLMAVLLAAAAYGVAHGYKDAKQFSGSLVAALIFTVAYVLSHSLWWLMLIHAGLPALMVLAGAGLAPRVASADSARPA